MRRRARFSPRHVEHKFPVETKGEPNMRKSGRKIAIIPVAALLSLAFASHAGAAPPANTAAPSVTGTPKVGEVLTAQNGTWANNPTAFQYQWQRCNAAGAACANIGTATLRTYTVATPDSGRTLRVRVTAVNAEGATNARSGPTVVVPPNAGPQNQQGPRSRARPRRARSSRWMPGRGSPTRPRTRTSGSGVTSTLSTASTSAAPPARPTACATPTSAIACVCS